LVDRAVTSVEDQHAGGEQHAHASGRSRDADNTASMRATLDRRNAVRRCGAAQRSASSSAGRVDGACPVLGDVDGGVV
jgi:hypothetical protein